MVIINTGKMMTTKARAKRSMIPILDITFAFSSS